MYLEVFPQNIDLRKIDSICKVLENGGIIIYPTDTIYGMGCDIYNKKAIERLCEIKKIPIKKANFSFICNDLSHLSRFTKSISTPLYRMLNANLPGPFTFILEASKEVPKLINAGKNTVGIRVPDNDLCRLLLERFGHPIISTSLPETENIEDITNPELIYYAFGSKVDAMLAGGIGGYESSTVVNCIGDEWEITRQGLGELNW